MLRFGGGAKSQKIPRELPLTKENICTILNHRQSMEGDHEMKENAYERTVNLFDTLTLSAVEELMAYGEALIARRDQTISLDPLATTAPRFPLHD